MVTCLTSVSANNILDSACTDVTIMGSSSGEGRSIIEGEGREIFGEFELFFEGLILFPELEDFLFFGWEGDSFGNWIGEMFTWVEF